MMRRLLLLFCLLPVLAAVSPAAGEETPPSCRPCHAQKTGSLVQRWQDSGHGRYGIACQSCHPGGYDANHPADGGTRPPVTAATCGRCHPDQLAAHRRSKHGIADLVARACTRNQNRTPEVAASCATCHGPDSGAPPVRIQCARFLNQTPEMRRQGCMGCHRIAQRCDLCHPAHDIDPGPARAPEVCATCHMGPDHAQYEIWATSRHGILFRQKGEAYAPSCQTCHMAAKDHDVSVGITMGLAGQPYPEERRRTERDKMLAICSRCHTTAMARRNLEDGDAVQRQAKALVQKAEGIVRDLAAAGLLLPDPTERPPHPLAGQQLVTGGQMLYEDISRPEAILFRMNKFAYVTAYKGVFHQNPDYAHWHGNAPLKLDLAELASEALLLKRLHRLEERLALLEKNVGAGAADAPDTALRQALIRLRQRYLAGELSRDEFQRRRDQLLDGAGL